MSEEKQRPRVGTGVLVMKDSKALLAKRIGGHGDGTWCFPGGKLEMFESWQECVRRETKEETGVEIHNIRLVAVTNDVEPENQSHYVTICATADWKSGAATVTEPDKFAEVGWFRLDQLPEPLYPPTRNFLENGYNPLTI